MVAANLQRKLAICLLELFVRRGALHAEHLVVAAHRSGRWHGWVWVPVSWFVDVEGDGDGAFFILVGQRTLYAYLPLVARAPRAAAQLTSCSGSVCGTAHVRSASAV